MNTKIKCDICTIFKFTTDDVDHIEGNIQVVINPSCQVHGHYLLLTSNKNHKFSIELIQQLEKQYEETC